MVLQTDLHSARPESPTEMLVESKGGHFSTFKPDTRLTLELLSGIRTVLEMKDAFI